MSELVRDAVTAKIEEFTESSELERRFREELEVRARAMKMLEQRRNTSAPEEADVPDGESTSDQDQVLETTSAHA